MDNRDSYTYTTYKRNKNRIQLVILCGVLYTLFLLYIGANFSGKYSIPFIFLVVFLFGVFADILSDLRRLNYFTWGRGTGAEWVMGSVLETLTPSYKLLPDYDTGRGNIDYICVGETGIFTIEVKAMRGVVTNLENRILINGQETERDFIGQAKAEAHYVENLLKEKTGRDYPVTSLLLFPHARVVIKRPVQGVWIGGRSFAPWLIKRGLRVLNETEIKEVLDFLDMRQREISIYKKPS